MKIERKQLLQQIGEIIGFHHGIELIELADLFEKLLKQSEGKDGE